MMIGQIERHTKERQRTLEQIRRQLQPVSPVFSNHPILRREAAYSRLQNLPTDAIKEMCLSLHVGAGELMDLLETEEIIVVPRSKSINHGLNGMTRREA